MAIKCGLIWLQNLKFVHALYISICQKISQFFFSSSWCSLYFFLSENFTEKHEMHGILGRNMSKSIFNFSGQARDRSDDSDNECWGVKLFSLNQFQKQNNLDFFGGCKIIWQFFQLPDTFSPELKNLLESLLQVLFFIPHTSRQG